jgi:hypothetical protein
VDVQPEHQVRRDEGVSQDPVREFALESIPVDGAQRKAIMDR